jgi:hypothetical protein
MNTTSKDLNDPLDELFGGSSTGAPRPMARPELAPIAKPTFIENCPKCRGTGSFTSWSGRHLGPCFACKGKGKNEFKTSTADRARARQGAADRKLSKEAQQIEDFKATHPAEFAWIQANPNFDFAKAMFDALRKWGSLTEKQLDAVRKCVAREEARKAERAARIAAAPTVDTSAIEAAFATARQAAADDREGIKWLALRLDGFKFSDAPAKGQWAAAIFVKEGETKLGRISGGKFTRSFACDDATEARIVAAIADPAAAAKAHGQRTGECSVCGRELTNADSRKLGIGPICAEKFGF